jgi:Ca2+-binding EF-hand superfamily protein
MKRILFSGIAAGFFALLASAILFGAAPPGRPSVSPWPPPKAAPLPATPEGTNDAVTYVFLASDRPVLLRLHLRVGKYSAVEHWDEFMNKLFAWFDRDGDGFLSKEEVEGRIPEINSFRRQFGGGIGGGVAQVPLATLDTDKDGRVSRQEFLAYYRPGPAGPISFTTNDQSGATRAVTDAFYKYLDTDRSGRLTREKFAGCWERLRRLDENEDEMLTPEELSRRGAGGGVYFEEVEAFPGSGRRPSTEPDFLKVEPAQTANLARQILARYDRDKDGKLDRTEVGFEAKVFDALDRNRDGKLDAEELAPFLTGEPDLALIARLGGSAASPAPVLGEIGKLFGGRPTAASPLAVFNPKKVTQPLAGRVKARDGQTLDLDLSDTAIGIQVNSEFFRRLDGVRQFYVQQFNSLDPDNRGYVERKQERENQGNPFLFQIFALVDRDMDGRITRKELNDWFDLLNEGSGRMVAIQVTDQGRSLFERIDANGDRQLSVRELRTAWDRLQPLVRDKGGLRREDIPRRITVAIGQGNAFFRGGAQMSPGGVPRSIGAVPAWFTKMDRNNDGDVSRQEFLGTDEEFRAIDTDGDGLISPEEARAFEARRKAAEKP